MSAGICPDHRTAQRSRPCPASTQRLHPGVCWSGSPPVNQSEGGESEPQVSGPVPERRSYLGIVAPPVVKADPLVPFGGVDHVLTLDPVDRCSLQEGAGLEKKHTLLTPPDHLREAGGPAGDPSPRSKTRRQSPGCRVRDRRGRSPERPVPMLPWRA